MQNLSEADIRRIAQEAVKQLGEEATPEAVEQVVKKAVDRIDSEQAGTQSQPQQSTPYASAKNRRNNRIIITAFGKNQKGILAGITGVLASHGCDIIDLSQKILQEFFTIMLLVDMAECDVSFEDLQKAVTDRGNQFGLKVVTQHEEIFNAMHRV